MPMASLLLLIKLLSWQEYKYLEARGRKQENSLEKQEARSKKQENSLEKQEAGSKKQENSLEKQEAGSRKQEARGYYRDLSSIS